MKNSIILVAVAAFVTCSVTIAKADSPFEPRSVIVQFSDLDTTNALGVAALYRRLKNAAASVCRELEPGKELARVRAYTDCVHTALSAAIVKVDRQTLAAYARAHGMPTGNSTIRIADNK